MTEPTAAPSADAPSDDVAALVGAYQAFLSARQQQFAAVAAALRGAIDGHDAALTILRAVLGPGDGPSWVPVVAYVDEVRECAVLPLRSALEALNLVEGSRQDWAQISAADGLAWSGLSKKDQQFLSPLVPYWRAASAVLQEIEFGVSEWTRHTLDAASGLDSRVSGSEADTAETEDDAEAETPTASEYEAAGEELMQHLGAALTALDGLTEGLLPTLSEQANARRRKLKAAAERDSAESDADDGQGEEATAWEGWISQANARVALSAARLAAFSALADMQVSLVEHLGRQGPGMWAVAAEAASGHLMELRAQAESLYAQLDQSHDGRQAVRQARTLYREATKHLDKDYVGVASPGEARRFVEERVAASLRDLRERVQNLPDVLLVHSLPETTETPVNPRTTARDVMLRSAADEAIDKTLEPAFAAVREQASSSIDTLAEEATNLQSVLRFHLGAAIEELQDAYTVRTSAEARGAADAAARELSLDGLSRVLETLAQQHSRVDDCLSGVSATLTEARKAVWLAIGSQLQAETATQKLTLKTRSTVTESVTDARTRATEVSTDLMEQTLRHLRTGFEAAKTALEFGRKALSGEKEPVDRQASIDAVARLADIRARLPVVYRRIFTFYPLDDETLLAGREQDLTWLRKQLLLWRRGRASAIVLSSAPGSGLTSFLNVAQRTCLRGCNVTEVEIHERETSEQVVTVLLAQALGLTTGEEPPDNLRALADRIMAREETGAVNVCIVDRLEHLMLRRIGGMDLLGRLLRLFSATDSRVFWIGTVSDFAWQLLGKSEPLALGLVQYRKMAPYDRPAVEEVIIKRHRRSGLPLVFDPPAIITPFFRRKLRKAGSDEERQAMLQAEYFDDLFAASGQNIMLALFYWHLSIICHAEPPSIQVKALPKLSFDFLDFLSLPEAFALKAFLEHATLTVEEFSHIADISSEASHEIFESLGNSMIVELDANEYRNVVNVQFERIEPDRRYRLRPLLVQPIIRFLRTRNIVH
ncbi:MAG: hypothetical protein AAFN78_10890 [Pseudomonadota bacterium]